MSVRPFYDGLGAARWRYRDDRPAFFGVRWYPLARLWADEAPPTHQPSGSAQEAGPHRLADTARAFSSLFLSQSCARLRDRVGRLYFLDNSVRPRPRLVGIVSVMTRRGRSAVAMPRRAGDTAGRGAHRMRSPSTSRHRNAGPGAKRRHFPIRRDKKMVVSEECRSWSRKSRLERCSKTAVRS
jgi:hypothetical protein